MIVLSFCILFCFNLDILELSLTGWMDKFDKSVKRLHIG